ncbi:MAG TPA: hypothetical protein VKU82_05285 [Planctomycetaceae bacterium]|nr:hypothetical protein [Planctomycetaceae bacterium]
MMRAPRDWRIAAFLGLACAVCITAIGCGESIVNSGVAPTGKPRGTATEEATAPPASVDREAPNSPSADQVEPRESASAAEPATGENTPDAGQIDPAGPRTFSEEGPDGALRINFDDLDLLKIINMDPVTPDCVEKMPDWLKGLNGKKVRIRGYMKPVGVSEGIPQFLFVRSTDLCCFGPKGKVYHMIAVTLSQGTTTDYIELKPFDVAGKFRIDVIQLEEGLVFLLYHIDDAAIIRK